MSKNEADLRKLWDSIPANKENDLAGLWESLPGPVESALSNAPGLQVMQRDATGTQFQQSPEPPVNAALRKVKESVVDPAVQGVKNTLGPIAGAVSRDLAAGRELEARRRLDIINKTSPEDLRARLPEDMELTGQAVRGVLPFVFPLGMGAEIAGGALAKKLGGQPMGQALEESYTKGPFRSVLESMPDYKSVPLLRRGFQRPEDGEMPRTMADRLDEFAERRPVAGGLISLGGEVASGAGLEAGVRRGAQSLRRGDLANALRRRDDAADVVPTAVDAAETAQETTERVARPEPVPSPVDEILADPDIIRAPRPTERTPEAEGFSYKAPFNRGVTFEGALEKARQMSDEKLIEAFKERARVATRTGGDQMARGDGYARANAASADARFDAYGQALDARGISRPSVTDSYRQVPEREVRERFHLASDVERAAIYDDDGLIQALRETEQKATTGTPDRTLIERLYVLAGEAKERGLIGDEFGGASPAVVRNIAAGGTGAAGGAALDEENRGRGALLGAGAALGITNTPRLLKGKPGKPEYLQDESVQAVLKTVSDGSEEGTSILSKLTDAPNRFARAGKNLYTQIIDEAAPLKRFGREIGGSESLADEAARARGWAGAAHVTLRSEFQPVIRAARGHEEGVVALTKAQRALELSDAGLQKTDIPRETLEQTVAKLQAIPEVQEASDALRGYYRLLLDKKLRNGVISQEQFDEITASGEYYVPFVRDFGSDINTTKKPQGAGGLLSRATGVRKMDEGLARAKTQDPFKQAVLDTMEAERRIAKQRVTNLVAKIVEENPEGAAPLIRKVSPQYIGTGNDGRPLLSDPIGKDGKIVQANVGGQRQFYEVIDDDLYDSWAAFDPFVGGIGTKIFRPFKETLRFGVTANPAFALANGIRDFAMSVVQYPSVVGLKRSLLSTGAGAGVGAAADSENRTRGALVGGTAVAGGIGAANAAAHIGRTISALTDIMGPEVFGATVGGTTGAFAGNEEGHPFLGFLAGAGTGATLGRGARAAGATGNREVYEQWVGGGGTGFGFYARDAKDAEKALRMLERDGVDLSDVLDVRRWGDAIGFISRAIEEAPRLARFKDVMKNTGDEATAVAMSRDLSLDFARQGRGMKGVNAANAFFNAQLQGWDKLVRMLNPTTEQGKRTYGIAATTILAPTVGLWAINSQNPEYWERPQWERNMYWLVPKPEGGFKRLPKPFEIGFIFASIPERLLDYAYTQNPEKLKFALSDLATQYGPGATLPLTTLGEPIIENIANHDFFRNRPVVGPHLEDLPDELQYEDRTSSAAVGIGKLTGFSPAKVDNFIRDITGSLGGEALKQTSKLARASGLDDRSAPIERGGPFLARFETQPDQISDSEMAIYRRWNEADAAYKGARHLYESGDPEKFANYTQKNRELLAAHGELKQLRADLDNVWEARRAIEDSELPPERKRELIGRINTAVSTALRSLERQPAYAQ